MSGQEAEGHQPAGRAYEWTGQIGMASHREAAAAEAIRVEQVAWLIRQTPKMAASSSAAALVVAGIMWLQAPSPFIPAWASLVVILALYGLPGWWRNRQRPRPQRVSDRALRRSVLSGGLVGLFWGTGIAVMLPQQAPAQEMFLLVVFTGVAAGGMLSLAVVPVATLVNAAAILTPVLARLAWTGTPLHLAFCAFAIVFVVCIVLIAREVYRSFVENVLMRVANQSLATELEATRTDLIDAIEAIDEAVAHYDAEGRLLVCNDNYRAMFPRNADKVRPGAHFTELLGHMVPSSDVDGEAMAADCWREWRLEHFRAAAGAFEHRKPDGRWYRSYDIRTRRGGVLSVHIEISALKEREAAHERAKSEAESASEAKSHFLALMSHELRTPLNAIIGFAELLEGEAIGPHSDPRYRDYAHSIRSAGGHLLRLINDILDLSKVEAGRMELQEQDVHLPSLVDDVIRLMAETARRAGVSLDSRLDGAPDFLYADLRALRQMLINLVSNAIKFTESGGSIEIEIEAGVDGLSIAVRDTGIGIEQADIPKILEPFGQARRPGQGHKQGTGLGLPLVQSLIELHDGRLVIKSAPGVGTAAILHFGPERLHACSRRAQRIDA